MECSFATAKDDHSVDDSLSQIERNMRIAADNEDRYNDDRGDVHRSRGHFQVRECRSSTGVIQENYLCDLVFMLVAFNRLR